MTKATQAQPSGWVKGEHSSTRKLGRLLTLRVYWSFTRSDADGDPRWVAMLGSSIALKRRFHTEQEAMDAADAAARVYLREALDSLEVAGG